MYILADNAHSYGKMIEILRLDYHNELGEELEAVVTEGLRLIHFKTPINVPLSSYSSVVNAMIYTIAEQSGLIGGEGLISSRDFLQFLRTTKPTMMKWRQWIFEIAPEVGTLTLSEDVVLDQDVKSVTGTTSTVEDKTVVASPQLLATFLALAKTPEYLKAFDLKVSEHLKLFDFALKRALKEKRKNPELDLWFDQRMRRYLFDMYEWAMTFIFRKEWERAYSITSEIMALSTYDGVGCRYIHVPLSIYLGHMDYARALLAGYQDDSYSARMNLALLLAVSEPKLAQRQIKKALALNPYGVKILKVFDPLVDFATLVNSYAAGSVEEAEMYAFETSFIWREIPSAWTLLESVK